MTASPSAETPHPLLWKRYRDAAGPLPAPLNATIETLLGHRSVRHYLPQPLPAGALELAFAAAQSASTSSNLQAWSVVVVADPALKARLNAVSGQQRHIEHAPVLLVWLADVARLRGLTDDGTTLEGLDYLESFIIGVVDAALAAQNAVSALDSQGLGTCYIGGIRNDAEAVARELDLPAGVFPVFGMTVGVPDPARPADVKPRLPQRAVVHHERYGTATLADDLAQYNGVMHQFQQEQSMRQADWTGQSARRVGSVEALTGRHRLADFLRRHGFPLK